MQWVWAVSRSSSTNASTNAEPALFSRSSQRSTNRAPHHRLQALLPHHQAPQRWSSADTTALNPLPASLLLHAEKTTTRYGAAEGLEERKGGSEIYGKNSAKPCAAQEWVVRHWFFHEDQKHTKYSSHLSKQSSITCLRAFRK